MNENSKGECEHTIVWDYEQNEIIEDGIIEYILILRLLYDVKCRPSKVTEHCCNTTLPSDT